jgi:hypothetical protein
MENSVMTAVEVLKSTREAGIVVVVDGEDLLLEARVEPPEAILQAIAHNKAAIVAILRRQTNTWSADEWQAFFAERAGIIEFDGRVSRKLAEDRAFQHCVIEWLNRNPAPSTPNSCAWCEGLEVNGAVILPFGTNVHGHTWLHHHCWDAWYASRENEAIEALSKLCIKQNMEG